VTLDLGAIIDSVTPLVGSVLDTSGTVVDILRDANLYDDATIDPTTLQIVDPTPEATVESEISALIMPAGAGQRPTAPQVQQTPGDYTVKISADVTDVKAKDVIVPSQCRDIALIGARLRILSVESSGAGLLRTLNCRIDVVPA
jgi:hypothetical protein